MSDLGYVDPDDPGQPIIDLFDDYATPSSIMGYDLILTCHMCPEQYDVMKDGVKVGYMRLRHGTFRVDGPDGQTIHMAQPKGDGYFEVDEREAYLKDGIIAIDDKLKAC